ncbi:hypothetical protein [Merismopedia glauca]|uniref:hypothetical protein n=1 Tax=Merismopedia glauca TaxID=292586 RepID=UPI001C624C0B|nr:hypothetical protein [Merismopedia glauca]
MTNTPTDRKPRRLSRGVSQNPISPAEKAILEAESEVDHQKAKAVFERVRHLNESAIS